MSKYSIFRLVRKGTLSHFVILTLGLIDIILCFYRASMLYYFSHWKSLFQSNCFQLRHSSINKGSTGDNTTGQASGSSSMQRVSHITMNFQNCFLRRPRCIDGVTRFDPIDTSGSTKSPTLVFVKESCYVGATNTLIITTPTTVREGKSASCPYRHGASIA